LLVALGVPSLGQVSRRQPPEVPVPEPTDIAVETSEVETPDESLVEESLVEEVSIDGMCGVY
jgi:mycofactocin precursor peptide MftA